MKTSRYPLLLPALFMLLLFVPWLGEMYFYSKGEPREAIVAVSMLNSGDWILPLSHGGDIPYKPPLLAWLIALASILFNGGHVSEFTSRLPSALAGVALLLATWRLVAGRKGTDRAWLTMGILATCFEFYRACCACRVDMVLTACMVGGIYALFTMDGNRLRVLWAVLLLSGATLAKGPVGTLLPCLAFGIYELLCRRNFFKTVGRLVLIALASFLLPAVWYWLAYRQGGDTFLSLALEENIGRLTGSMGYESHVNPWYYNVITLAAGLLPWTLPFVVSLCLRPIRRLISKLWNNRSMHTPSLGLLAWVVGLTVFVFYCIPSSKRSVYLLPCYPFMAYGVALFLGYRGIGLMMRVFARIFAWLAVIAPAAILAASLWTDCPVAIEKLEWHQWIMALICMFLGLWWLLTRTSRADGAFGSLMLVYIMMITYSATIAPAVMNPRSDIGASNIVEQIVPSDESIVTYIGYDSLMRYYTMNYYLNDRLRLASDAIGAEHWLITDSLAPENRPYAVSLTDRSCDTRRPAYLVPPVRHRRNLPVVRR